MSVLGRGASEMAKKYKVNMKRHVGVLKNLKKISYVWDRKKDKSALKGG